MRGFDPEFSNIVDYILKITFRIWEGKQVELCLKYYSDDCPIYTLAGLSKGSKQVWQNTLNTLAAFPDRQLHADAVLWGGNDTEGYHTSHLINTTMTHTGDSELGPPTGKHASFHVIAHCIIKDNKIIEEWLVRDNYSLVKQLGFEPLSVAQKNAQQTESLEYQQWRESEFNRVMASHAVAKVVSETKTLPIETAIVYRLFQSVWNNYQLLEVQRLYAPTAKVHASSHRELDGHAQITAFYQELIQTLSDLSVSADYVCQQGYRVHKDDTKNGAHVAARWTMAGNHTGNTLWGDATNTPILILGESHYHIVGGRIVEEWTVFDELAILTQISRARARAQA